MTAFDIYLISTLDSILTVCGLLAGVSVTAAVLSIGAYVNFDNVKYLKCLKKAIAVFICSVLALVFIPTSKTVLAMYTIPPVIAAAQTNQEIQKLPENVLKFINNYLEKYSEEIETTK